MILWIKFIVHSTFFSKSTFLQPFVCPHLSVSSCSAIFSRWCYHQVKWLSISPFTFADQVLQSEIYISGIEHVLSSICRTTFVAVILEYNGLYCAASWSPRWGYVYVRPSSAHLLAELIELLNHSVFVCLGNNHHFRFRVNRNVLPNPALCADRAVSRKTSAAAEAVCCQGCWLVSPSARRWRLSSHSYSTLGAVFLTFWQATFLSVLSMVGVVKNVCPLCSYVCPPTISL
jgi:hypothetical protein